MARKKEGRVHGIGINNADYAISRYEMVNGRSKQVWMCPHYVVWKDMLKRCYSGLELKKHPTYQGCLVCPEWIYFMTFKAWMITQDWDGKQLDKDILVEGNKGYGPDTCRFVNALVNTFLTDHGAARGEWPLGVCWDKDRGRFQAYCNNPFTKKKEHLGRFTCPNEAHEVWRKRKHQHACALADLQDDPLIAEALRQRFTPKWINKAP